MVVIPPADARVVKPTTDKLLPTFKLFSIPTPPWVIIDPLSFEVESSALFTNNISLNVIVLDADSKIKLPMVDSTLLPSIFTLSTCNC